MSEVLPATVPMMLDVTLAKGATTERLSLPVVAWATSKSDDGSVVLDPMVVMPGDYVATTWDGVWPSLLQNEGVQVEDAVLRAALMQNAPGASFWA